MDIYTVVTKIIQRVHESGPGSILGPPLHNPGDLISGTDEAGYARICGAWETFHWE